MTTELILKSDVLDIIFHNRNKTYGAYMLRKYYPNRVQNSLFIMLGLVVLVSAFTFLPNNKIILDKSDTTTVYTLHEPAPEKKPDEPKPKTKPNTAQRPTQKLISSLLIVNQDVITDSLNEITDLLAIGSQTTLSSVTGPGIGDLGPEHSGPATATPATAADLPVVTNQPVDNPDVQASFPGGEKELIRFLQKNMRTPGTLDENQVVQVRVKFVVGFDGSLQQFSVIQDGGEIFNNEVVRVLKKMPRWNPGKMGGQNVPVYYSIPVKFMAVE